MTARLAISATLLMFGAAALAQRPDASAWPPITNETKPWTRWWWHGSAVSRAELTRELDALRAAGIGGVEITPIYGVRGEEKRFIAFLSDEWMAMLEHTLREAQRLGIGVDMATGTGWPFGGPWVGDDAAPRTLLHKTWTLEEGQQIPEPIRLKQTPLVRALGNQIHVVNEGAPGDAPRNPAQQPTIRPEVRPIHIGDLMDPVAANRNLQALALEQVKYPRDLPIAAVVAYGESGDVIDLSSHVGKDGTLDWRAPTGRWKVYAVFAGWHGKLVERAAPGGEGNVIDHFSLNAIVKYLAPFDRAFARRTLPPIRAFFNDSYEVDDASGQGNWTPALFDEFQKRRGYDLRRYLPALYGEGDEATVARVVSDYRETISDLLLDTFTTKWGGWAHRYGRAIRNQAHGSPANLLDLYAASDIPETEGTDIPRFKWATSTMGVAGRRLVSAEAATWLGEHFRSTLAEVKAAVDHFFVTGVNHIVYHGTAYSPDEDPWPGWQFYAAVEFNPQNAWWDDFSALNRYVTRVQSFLQSGVPDHDVLLYFPFHDAVATRGKDLLTHFGGANRPTAAKGFETAAATLQARGFTYDYISDRQIRGSRGYPGRIVTPGKGTYRTLILPSARFIALETFQHAIALARSGATIVSLGAWPDEVAGLARLDERRRAFEALKNSVVFEAADGEGIRTARVGKGRVLQGNDVERLLTRAAVAREHLSDHGLHFARRSAEGGRFYFVNNRTDQAVEGWIPFSLNASATIFDPLRGRVGVAPIRAGAGGTLDVYLQVPAGGSLVVAAGRRVAAPYEWHQKAGDGIEIRGPWKLQFVKGGPTLPTSRTLTALKSWTATGGDEVKSFSGSATYTVTFPQPTGDAARWELNLGKVHESARVRLNGRDLGTFIGPEFRVVIRDTDLRPTNTLEVTVTNLSANRIADLDRRGVAWKKFYNVNMPARLPQNRGPDGLFTAAKWEALDSGLVGPVTLSPVRIAK